MFLFLKHLSMSVHGTDDSPSFPEARVAVDATVETGGACTTLTVWRKSLLVSCEGFTVIDSKGDLIYRVDNYARTRPDEIILMDKDGNSLLLMHRTKAGDNDGLLLRGLKREDIQQGMVIAKPCSCKTAKKFEAEFYVLTKDDTAFFSNYRPQFYLRTADVTGKVELPENVKMVMLGDNVTAVFELMQPACPTRIMSRILQTLSFDASTIIVSDLFLHLSLVKHVKDLP